MNSFIYKHRITIRRTGCKNDQIYIWTSFWRFIIFNFEDTRKEAFLKLKSDFTNKNCRDAENEIFLSSRKKRNYRIKNSKMKEIFVYIIICVKNVCSILI